MGRREKEHGEGGKNNPPPQAFCLTCVDAKRGLGGFFPPLVLFFCPVLEPHGAFSSLTGQLSGAGGVGG